MPDLIHTLQGQDLSFLRMVANAWGVELTAPDTRTAAAVLVAALNDHSLFQEILDSLPYQQAEILEEISSSGGKIPWARFVRKFGDVRSMGAGKRDRERPDLNPASPVESLWYRALIGKAFLRGETELQEYVYIPDEFLNFLNKDVENEVSPPGRPASPAETAFTIPVNDRILDDCCTLLAALRTGEPLGRIPLDVPLIPLGSLLRSINLIDSDNLPNPAKSKKFLETSRSDALADLVFSWMNSTRFNELRLLPDLIFEGEWINDPQRARSEILDELSRVPQGQWWNLSSFIQAVKDQKPDFQRPAGDFDSWFIRQKDSQEYMGGFSHWDEIEGELIRFMVCGPLHWLGILDLASPGKNNEIQAFRHSSWSEKLWQAVPPAEISGEDQPITIYSSGIILVPRLAPRSIRYQAARFGEWQEGKEGHYRYRITPGSLTRAQNQGLTLNHILAVLKKGSHDQLPPKLVTSLQRWDKFGVESKIVKMVVMKVNSQEIIEILRKSRASRYLGEMLNPTTVQVLPRGLDTIRDVLAENGILAEMDQKV